MIWTLGCNILLFDMVALNSGIFFSLSLSVHITSRTRTYLRSCLIVLTVGIICILHITLFRNIHVTELHEHFL